MHCVQNFRNKVTDMILTIVPVPLNSNHSNQSWYCAFWVPQKLVLSSLPTILGFIRVARYSKTRLDRRPFLILEAYSSINSMFEYYSNSTRSSLKNSRVLEMSYELWIDEEK